LLLSRDLCEGTVHPWDRELLSACLTRAHDFPKAQISYGPIRAELMLPNRQNGSYQIRFIVCPQSGLQNFLDEFSNMDERYNVGCFLIRLF
jgi:hypothetical protein